MGEPEKNSHLFILYDYVVVIQLVRMPACQVGCRGFKSHLLLIIEVYTLGLINRRKVSWLHVCSTHTTSTIILD